MVFGCSHCSFALLIGFFIERYVDRLSGLSFLSGSLGQVGMLEFSGVSSTGDAPRR